MTHLLSASVALIGSNICAGSSLLNWVLQDTKAARSNVIVEKFRDLSLPTLQRWLDGGCKAHSDDHTYNVNRVFSSAHPFASGCKQQQTA
jgi:hypothetical protein